MELLDIKIFCDLIELKSFTEAAKKNYLTQSAVSQRINKLNEYYGNKIFLNKKKLDLSWHGEYLYEKFKDILKIYSSTEDIIGHKNAKDVLSAGFSGNAKTKYYNKYFINRILREQFLLEIYFAPSLNIYEKVLFGTLDYGVIGNLPQTSRDIICNKLYTEKIVLVTDGKNRSENIKLHEIPIILDHRDSGLYLFLKDQLKSRNEDIEQLNIKGFVGTSSEKFVMLSDTEFYCFLPEWYLEDATDFKIVSLDFNMARDFYEIYRKDRDGKVSIFRDIIREYNNSSV